MSSRDPASDYGIFGKNIAIPWQRHRGSAKIERAVASYRLSRDLDKYDRLSNALALYRLTLCQPRQEDMVELLRKRGQSAVTVPPVDLRPPR